MHVILSKSAEKDYKALPKPEQIKIKRKLTLLTEQPYTGKKLSGELAKFRSIRAWPYRIIYVINEKEARVEVRVIEHRQGVYR